MIAQQVGQKNLNEHDRDSSPICFLLMSFVWVLQYYCIIVNESIGGQDCHEMQKIT